MKGKLNKIFLILSLALVASSCEHDVEYYHQYKRSFGFETDQKAEVTGGVYIPADTYIFHPEYPMLFEATSGGDYFSICVPVCYGNGSRADGVVLRAADSENPAASVRSLKLVFNLSDGKFSGGGRWETRQGGLSVELYAYEGYKAGSYRYSYSAEVIDASVSLDYFSLKDSNCDKVLCIGDFVIHSEVHICREDTGAEIAVVPFNLLDGYFKCVPYEN